MAVLRPDFGVFHAERRLKAVRKMVKRIAKGGLLQCERPPFAELPDLCY